MLVEGVAAAAPGLAVLLWGPCGLAQAGLAAAGLAVSYSVYGYSRLRGGSAAPVWVHPLAQLVYVTLSCIGLGASAAAALGLLVYTAALLAAAAPLLEVGAAAAAAAAAAAPLLAALDAQPHVAAFAVAGPLAEAATAAALAGRGGLLARLLLPLLLVPLLPGYTLLLSSWRPSAPLAVFLAASYAVKALALPRLSLLPADMAARLVLFASYTYAGFLRR